VARSTTDVLQGTFDLFILKALSLEPMHAWGLSQRLQQLSQDQIQVNPGSLYPALERLQNRGWLAAGWSTTANNRRAKFYRLTAAGRRQLDVETDTWRRYAGLVDTILRTT
jgi:transcriptional regulator